MSEPWEEREESINDLCFVRVTLVNDEGGVCEGAVRTDLIGIFMEGGMTNGRPTVVVDVGETMITVAGTLQQFIEALQDEDKRINVKG
jgi:hypothetical protein